MGKKVLAILGWLALAIGAGVFVAVVLGCVRWGQKLGAGLVEGASDALGAAPLDSTAIDAILAPPESATALYGALVSIVVGIGGVGGWWLRRRGRVRKRGARDA